MKINSGDGFLGTLADSQINTNIFHQDQYQLFGKLIDKEKELVKLIFKDFEINDASEVRPSLSKMILDELSRIDYKRFDKTPFNSYPDKFVNTANEVPKDEHYAIIQSDSIYIPGDERSRTCPGHGYPAETKQVVSYEVYLTKEKLMTAIQELENPKYGYKKEYVAVKVTPIKVTTTLSIDIQETQPNEITSAKIIDYYKDGGTQLIRYIKNGIKEICYKDNRINTTTKGTYYKTYVHGGMSEKLTPKDAMEIENLLNKE
jgi:hypothetical protein